MYCKEKRIVGKILKGNIWLTSVYETKSLESKDKIKISNKKEEKYAYIKLDWKK